MAKNWVDEWEKEFAGNFYAALTDKWDDDEVYEPIISFIKSQLLALLDRVEKEVNSYECKLNKEAHKEANGNCHTGAALADIFETLKEIRKEL
jgi:hypothetical protein